ncbi:Aste57867_2649 [Aphanomyces stellatus]|uniref:Aste57867_2649 protein n=1 Tax=Aphanomyces stellatus TaxID=120398 RepID=A0A485K803_9STRA|nr:hypothetical protein As57867_002642 [Aphanomyces stellatus]VFT79843.1 Aste57867_2649 [Aphanomyces stellatus]
MLERDAGQLDSIPMMDMQPVPANWQNPIQEFGGGNPMCVLQPAATYVQQFFFYDACGTTVPFSLTVTMYSTLFASLTMATNLDIQSTCRLATTDPHPCVEHLETVRRIATTVGLTLPQSASSTRAAIDALDIAIAQYATTTPQVEIS